MRIPAIVTAFILAVSGIHAAGFANGVKIGEVTDTSVVLWTRLTKENEATNRVDKWKPNAPNWTVPGAEGKVLFRYWKTDAQGTPKETNPVEIDASTDFCQQFKIKNLSPATTYGFRAYGENGDGQSYASGSFTTAPKPDSEESILFTVSTCQEFELRDDKENGHKIYRSMLGLKPDFFIQTGDTLYYDRKPPLSKNMELARYRWGRMYALPFQTELHRQIPTYWMHDDHDLLKNDCWPGQSYGDLTWEQGLKIWHEQIPQSDKPYRTFRWGKNLQIWLPEGREFRSPNNMEDGPEKSTDLRDKLEENTRFPLETMTAAGFDIKPGEHAIVPVMLGDAALAAKFDAAMWQRGLYVVGISYLIVPQGKARIRTQISAAHSREDLERAVAAFIAVREELGLC